jgi:hypothetical protein
MYCTHCHTGWDEHSQEILSGVVMNPHFFESIDRLNAQGTERPGYVFADPPPDWASSTSERSRAQPSLKQAVYIYYGLCAYIFDCALEHAVTNHTRNTENNFLLEIAEVYPHLHMLNEAFVSDDWHGWENKLSRFVQQIYTPSHGYLRDVYWSRIIFDWSNA